LAPKENEPATPTDLDLRTLPRAVRAELRSLTPEHAEVVGAHLLMAGMLIDSDPELAYAHAEAARRRAARLPVTREATGETAYAAGHYDVALNEFRALRRMSGTTEYLPAMADCERALGRPQAALKLVAEGMAAQPDVAQAVELRLVEAGVRVDAGQADEALRLLRTTLEQVGTRGPKLARARLRFAYADLLEFSGENELAERWFTSAAALDVEQVTDAEERAAALQGVTIVFDDSDEDDSEESDGEENDSDGDEDESRQPGAAEEEADE
jgi:tetratricopeptide (TPR) repeat protein